MRSPNFIGVGTQKSGTSWAYFQLLKHPQIKFPLVKSRVKKEFHFFDFFKVSSYEYFNKFNKIPSQYKTGEFTPGYFSVPYVPELINSFCPNAKLFVIFRNPVERAFSQYRDHLFLGKIPKNTSFRVAFDEDYPKERYCTIKERGLYFTQLKKWKYSNIKIFWYDDLIINPVKFIRELYSWVEVDSSFLHKNYLKRIIKKYNIVFRDMKITEEDKKYVSEFYKEEILNLGEITKRDLSKWLTK